MNWILFYFYVWNILVSDYVLPRLLQKCSLILLVKGVWHHLTIKHIPQVIIFWELGDASSSYFFNLSSSENHSYLVFVWSLFKSATNVNYGALFKMVMRSSTVQKNWAEWLFRTCRQKMIIFTISSITAYGYFRRHLYYWTYDVISYHPI